MGWASTFLAADNEFDDANELNPGSQPHPEIEYLDEEGLRASRL